MGKWTYKKPASDAGKRRKKNRLASERQAVWDGIISLTRNEVKSRMASDTMDDGYYLLLLRRLQSRQSIWQLEAIVRPPSTHGVI